eukprot:COSAG01_NODE_4939_length_4608_cov_66.819694_2_plen_106_part_00
MQHNCSLHIGFTGYQGFKQQMLAQMGADEFAKLEAKAKKAHSTLQKMDFRVQNPSLDEDTTSRESALRLWRNKVSKMAPEVRYVVNAMHGFDLHGWAEFSENTTS